MRSLGRAVLYKMNFFNHLDRREHKMNASFNNYLETNGFSFDDLVILWNEYAVEREPETYIWGSIEDYANEIGADGTELARMVFFGEVSSWNDRVYVNAYGNFVTCDSISSSPIDFDILAEWLEETNHNAFLAWKESNETEE